MITALSLDNVWVPNHTHSRAASILVFGSPVCLEYDIGEQAVGTTLQRPAAKVHGQRRSAGMASDRLNRKDERVVSHQA